MASPLIGIGTVTSTTDIAWTGDTLTKANCYEGFPVVVNKEATFVASRIDTTHFTVNPPVSNGVNLSVAISPLTPQQITIAELNVRAAELLEQLSVTDANGRGLFYNILSYTAANDPGPGFLARNNSSWSSVTELYIDSTDANNQVALDRILLWNQGTVLTIRSIETAAFVAFDVIIAPIAQSGDGWALMSVEFIESSGILTDGEAVGIEWNRVGKGLASVPSGEWDVLTSYDTLAMVEYGGAIFISNVDGNLGHQPDISPEPTSDAYWTVFPLPSAGDFFDIAIFAQGVYADGEMLHRHVFASTSVFPIGLVGSQVSSVGPAAAATTLQLKKNGVTFGTINWGIGDTVATYTSVAGATFDAGDVLTVIVPTPADTTLSSVAGTIRGSRNADLPISQSGMSEVDFGTFPGQPLASLAVTGVGRIKANSKVTAWIFPDDGTADHTADEHIVVPLQVTASNVVAGVGFTLNVVALPDGGREAPRYHGLWNVAWFWI